MCSILFHRFETYHLTYIIIYFEISFSGYHFFLLHVSYYGFSNIKTNVNENPGYDRVRKEEINVHVNRLQYYEEVYTSKNWMVRVYKVKPSPLL